MRHRPFRLLVAGLALAAAFAVVSLGDAVFPHLSINHDEGVYLQQAAMLLEGQLRLQPPLDEVFRPWFFVDGPEGLYPKYTPVTAAIFALGGLIGEYRLALGGIAAANVTLLALTVATVWDRRTGVLAGAILLGSPLFLVDSAVFLPYAPATMLNLAFALGYVRTVRTGQWAWAAVAGLAVGAAFFARPYTTVLFASPFVVHAGWLIYRMGPSLGSRFLIVGVGGASGLTVAVGYNALLTGHPLRFPYMVFGPRDGIGFGTRALLGYELEYTPGLALRANLQAVGVFATEWVLGGLLGVALAALGMWYWFTLDRRHLGAPFAGVAATVLAGNLYFWGTHNILGNLERSGDGLISFLGPYYHFDLLVPVAAFGAVGVLALAERLRGMLATRDAVRYPTLTFAVVLLVLTVPVLGVTAGTLDDRIDRNRAVTEVYERTYTPVHDRVDDRALVLLPTPYGDWLHHPFQALRNDPGYDDRILYAIDDRPIETARALPSRRLYRLVHRGPWAPQADSPRAVRVQRVHVLGGDSVLFQPEMGIPAAATAVTVRLGTPGDGVYVATHQPPRNFTVRVVILGERAVLYAGNGTRRTISIAGQRRLTLTAFVESAGNGGFTYRFSLPIATSGRSVTVATPRIERCVRAGACGGQAAHIPATAPRGVYVNTVLAAFSGDSIEVVRTGDRDDRFRET